MGSGRPSANSGFLKAIAGIHEGTRYRMKDLEKARVFGEICARPGTTRIGIIKRLGLRPTSVSHAVGELVGAGLVAEAREDGSPGRLGRPEIAVYPRSDRFVAIAVYITSRTLKAFLVNAFEQTLATMEVVLSETTTNREFARKFGSLARALRASVPEGSELIGVSLSLPGFMDMGKRQWIFASRWPAIKKLPFKDLEREAGAPLVLSRVLDAGLEYLIARDPDLEKGDALLVHWGYGIGAAYANNGRVLSSSIGGVCEIGHWKIRDDGTRPCACGALGCLEAEAALWSIVPRLREEYPDFPEQEDLMYDYLKGRAEVTGHPVLRSAIAATGRAISMLFVTLFPRKVYVYGPLALLPEVREALAAECARDVPDFARSHLALSFLDSGYRGEQIGSTRRLFIEAYRRRLRADAAG